MSSTVAAAEATPSRISSTNLTGLRFGRILVLDRVYGCKNPTYTCRCDCGVVKAVDGRTMVTGQIKSCGCWRQQHPPPPPTTHGASRSKAYRVWWGMRQRCENPSTKEYARYGDRGIRVCERWQSFENFLSDMGQPGPNRSIERIDNDGNYEPQNCCWATRSQQQRNKRSSRLITAFGETKTLADWLEDPRCAVRRSCLEWRLNHRVGAEIAITKSSQKRKE